ncbi:MAG: hypothetical protein ACLVJ6_10180 [Merdibacter sp.]
MNKADSGSVFRRGVEAEPLTVISDLFPRLLSDLLTPVRMTETNPSLLVFLCTAILHHARSSPQVHTKKTVRDVV